MLQLSSTVSKAEYISVSSTVTTFQAEALKKLQTTVEMLEKLVVGLKKGTFILDKVSFNDNNVVSQLQSPQRTCLKVLEGMQYQWYYTFI